jgi:hypothetical protein
MAAVTAGHRNGAGGMIPKIGPVAGTAETAARQATHQ